MAVDRTYPETYTPAVADRSVKARIRLGGLLNEFPSHGLRKAPSPDTSVSMVGAA